MENDVSLDEILQQLGAFGKYNIVNYALLLFPIYLAGIYGSIYVFEAPDISYRCYVSQCEALNDSFWREFAIPKEKNDESKFAKCEKFRLNEDIANGTCTADSFGTKREKCNEFIYDGDSAVKDFNLGCKNWERTFIGTIHNAGLFVSLPLTGIISDKYGRKLALSIASLMNGLFGFLRSFSTNYVMMVVFEFLEAALGAGAYTTAFVIAMELVGPKGRVFGNTLINAAYVMGVMTLAGLSWWLQNWRTLLRVVYTPAMLVLSYYWILNESLRWLISKGRHHDAAVIIKKAAKMNKVELSDEILAPFYELEKLTSETDAEKQYDNEKGSTKVKDSSNIMRAIKSSIIMKRVAICSFLWITCTFVYYGMSINSVAQAGNMYVNFMLSGFVEIPANFVCLLVLDRFGRKKVLIVMYLLTASLCLSLLVIPKDQKVLSLVLYLTGKFSITVAYSAVYIYVSEVFPTNVRQSLLAICSSLGRVGSTLAPLTPMLTHLYDKLPILFFGSLTLVASALVLTLPETLNVPLPNSIEEAENLSKRKKARELT